MTINKAASRGRLLRTALVLALAVGLVAGSRLVEQPVDLSASLGVSNAPSETASGQSAAGTTVDRARLVCPGPEQRGLIDSSVSDVDQEVLVQAVAAPREALGAVASDTGPGRVSIESQDASIWGSVDTPGEVVSTKVQSAEAANVLGQAGLAPGLSAAQVWLGTTEQQLGLALTSCRPPRQDTWLVAGGGKPGRSERLVLSNPNPDALTASVEIFSSVGPPIADAAEVVLGPGERTVLLLDAIAHGEAAPVVHVSTDGIPVSAYLADRWLEGSTDRGVELSPATTEPEMSHRIAAVVVPPGSKTSASVRAAVIGKDQGVVKVRALGPDGPVRVAQEVSLVGAERSADINISDLPAGAYTLEVSSDVHIVVAASVTSDPDEQDRRDLTWIPAAPPVSMLTGTPLPQPEATPVEYQLQVASVEGAGAQVITLDGNGSVEATEIDVPAERNVSIDLVGATAVWVRPLSGEISAAVSAQALVSAADIDGVRTDNIGDEERPAPEDATDKSTDSGGATGNDNETPGPVRLTSVLALQSLSVLRTVRDIEPALP